MLKKLVHILWMAVFVYVLMLASMTHSASASTWTGSGTPQDPYILYTPEDFIYFANHMPIHRDQHFELGSDLDFSGVSFKPFGEEMTFGGTFNGNGYTISNITLDKQTGNSRNFLGVFSSISSTAVLKNIKVKKIRIDGDYMIGGLVGANSGGKILNSSVEGGSIAGYSHFGGLVGTMDGGSITNSYAEIPVAYNRVSDSDKNANNGVGGLVGTLRSGTISNSFYLGNVYGYWTVGGLVGYSDRGGIIRESIAIAEVKVQDEKGDAAGLVGVNYGEISDSYFQGSVVGVYVGGLAGVNLGDITNSYTMSLFDLNEYWRPYGVNLQAGGIVWGNSGYQTESGIKRATITNTFFNLQTAEIDNLLWQNMGVVTNSGGKAWAELQQQSTYTGWDFNHTWAINEYNGTPYIKKANLIEFDSYYRKIVVESGQTASMDLTSIYSNGQGENAVGLVSVELVDLPGTTYAKTHDRINITGGQEANGYIKVTYQGVSNQFPVTVTPGPISVSRSTVVAESSSIVADGSTIANIVVTAVDDRNNPLTGLSVSLYGDDGGLSTITPAQQTTDQDGRAIFTVKSSKLGTSHYHAVVVDRGQQKRIGQEATVDFVPGPPVASASSIVVTSTGTYTVGKDKAVIEVTIKDQSAHPVENALVELIPDPGFPPSYLTTVTPSAVMTDANGRATFEVSSTWAQSITLTAKVDGTEMSGLSTHVTFEPDAAEGEHSVMSMMNDTIKAGKSGDVIIQLKDQYGNALTSGGDASNIEWDASIRGKLSLVTDHGNGTYTFTYMAPEIVGNDTIRAVIGNTSIPNPILLSIVPDAADGSYSDIIMDHAPIAVGQSRELHVELRDQYGNVISGGVDVTYIVLDSSMNGSIVFDRDNGDGTYVYIYTAPVTAGTDTITGTVSGTPMKKVVHLPIIPGSVAQGVVEPVNRSIAVGQELLVTVLLNDQYGNPVPNMKVGVRAPEDSAAIPSQEGIDYTDANGSVTYDLKSTVAGDRTFHIFYVQDGSEVHLTDYDVTFTAGDVDIQNSSLTLTKQIVTADGIDAVELLIVLKDQYRNPVPDTAIVVETGNTNAKIEHLIHPTDAHGEARIKVTNLVAETLDLTIHIDDPDLSNTRLGETEITFVPGTVSHSTSAVSSDSSIMRADQQQYATVTVELKDAYHNPIPNQRVALRQTGSSTITPDPAYADGDVAITDQTGTVQFIVSSTKAETVVYQAVVYGPGGDEVALDQTVTVTIISGPMYAGNSEMAVSSNRLVADGSSSARILVQLKDEHGNNLADDSGTLEIYANSDKLTVHQAVYGAYTADYTAPTAAGKVLITAYHIDESGAASLLPAQEEIDIVPGPAAMETSTVQARESSLYADGTSQTTIIVQLKDRYLNDLTDETMQGEIVEIMTNLGVIGTVQYIGNGRFAAVLTVSNDVGTAVITAMLNQQLIDDIATVDFTLGPVSLAKSTITADQTSISADGVSTATIQVQLMDDYGHRIERDEGEVLLTTTLGTISQAEYVAAGMYHAVLTAGIEAGQAIITGSLSGDPLHDKADVEFMSYSSPYPGPGSAPEPIEPAPSPVPDNVHQSEITVYTEGGKETTISFIEDDITSDRPIAIETEWMDGEARISFTSSAIEYMMELNSSQRIEIEAGGTLYVLPIDQLDIDEIAQTLGDREFEIMIEFKTAEDEVAAAALAAVEQLGAEMLAAPIQFTITAAANGGNDVQLDHFTRYVMRTFVIDGTAETYYVTGARYQPDTGEFEPVPTTFELQAGKTIVHLYSLSNSYYTVIRNDIAFIDMQAHWAKTEVERMANKWIIKGKGNDRFDPNGSLTRAEAITLLVRALGLNNVTEDSPYRDVSREWFADAVNTAFAAGLIVASEGAGPGALLKPTEEISREELTVMLVRAIHYAGMTEEQGELQQPLRFHDDHAISEWAKEPAAIAVQYGIIKGDGRGNFNPQNTTSRAEAAVMLDRLLQVLGLSN